MTRPLLGLLLWVLGLLAGPRRSIGEPRRVLVLRIDERVGNVLLTTPVLSRLREALPDAQIDALVSRKKAPIVEGLARVVPFEKKDLFRRPWRFFALLFRLRRARYDVAIDASHWHSFSASSALLLGWIAAGVRVAHDRGPRSRWATDRVPLPAGEEPEIVTKLGLLAPLGLAPGEARMTTRLGAACPPAIEAWCARRGPLVGLGPGGRKADHRMPVAVFAALAGRAKALGATPVVLWGPGEEALAEELSRAAELELAPPTDLDALAALMRRCRAVVVNDTGPMHLAVAVGTPTIALFTKPAGGRWGHAEPPHAVVEGAGKSEAEVTAEACAALERMLRDTP